MAVNSSSSVVNSVIACSDSKAGLFIGTSHAITRSLLLLPLSIFVLHLGHQAWRQQRSFSTMSHPDVFTYHLAAMELIFVLGSVVFVSGWYAGLSDAMAVGFHVCYTVFPGQMSFHILTCVERYLAVVHPVTYLGLKQSVGVRIRNISTVCVWLLCIGLSAALRIFGRPVIIYFCPLVFSLIVVSFCSLRALCVLIRPRPGEVGGNREWVDQSKKRAFHTIMAIMAVLWLWFVGFLVCVALGNSNLLSYNDYADIWILVLSAQQFCFTSAVSTQSRKTALLPLKQ